MRETTEHGQQAVRDEQNDLAVEQKFELAVAAYRRDYEEAYKQGQREALERVLIIRFGELPDWVGARLAAVPAAEVVELSGEALDEMGPTDNTPYVLTGGELLEKTLGKLGDRLGN